jgi:hypothetical protein
MGKQVKDPAEDLKGYYQYLVEKKADVPDNYDSFSKTLQNETDARTFHKYLIDKGFDAPEDYNSFAKTFNLTGVKKKVGGEPSSTTLPAPSPAADYRESLAQHKAGAEELEKIQANAIAIGDVLRNTDEAKLADPAERLKYQALLGEYNNLVKDQDTRVSKLRGLESIIKDQRGRYVDDNQKKQEELFDMLGMDDKQVDEIRKTIFKQQHPDQAAAVDAGTLIPTDIDVDTEDLAKALTNRSFDQLKIKAGIEENKDLSDRVFGSFLKSVTKTLAFELPASAGATISNFMADLKIRQEDIDKPWYRASATASFKQMIDWIPGAKDAVNEKVDNARVAAFEWSNDWLNSPANTIPGIGPGGTPVTIANPQNMIKSLSQVKRPLDVIDYVFASVGQGVAQIPLAVATKGVTAYSQEIGHTYLEGVLEIAREKGMTPEEVIKQDLDEPIIARTFGAVQGAMESFGAGKVTKSLGFGEFRKDLKQRSTKWLKDVADSGKTEFITEALQGGSQQIAIQKMTGLGTIDAVKNLDWLQMLDEGIAGAIGGSSITAGGTGATALARRMEYLSNLKKNPQEADVFENVVDETAKAAQEAGDPRTTEEIKTFIKDEVIPEVEKKITPEPKKAPVKEKISPKKEEITEKAPEVSKEATPEGPIKVQAQPVTELSTDLKRFQNREEEFSEESVQGIVNAVLEGKFDINEFDPIRTWKDPKDKKQYVLAGHSRSEAFRRLQSMLDKGEIPPAAMEKLQAQGITDFKNIPSIDVSSKSESEAIEFAKERSNVMSTKETVLDRAKLIADKRGKGTSETALRRDLKASSQEILLSYLKPQGKAWDAVKLMQKAETAENTRRVLQIGEFIGEARKRFPQLTDSHENELYDFLATGTGQRITTRPDFIDRLDNVVNNISFQSDTTQPLNLENRSTKGFNEGVISKEINDNDKRIKELESEGKSIKNPPGPARMVEITRELGKLYQERVRLRENLDRARKGDREQFGLFDAPTQTTVQQQSTPSVQQNAPAPVEATKPVEEATPGQTPTEAVPEVPGAIETIKRSARIEQEIDDLFDDLGKTLKSTLAAGLNPEATAIASKIVAKYIELGVVKFAEIAQKVYQKYGEQRFREFFTALKAGYGSILATAEDTTGLNTLEEVRSFTDDSLVNLFKQLNPEQNDTATAGSVEPDSTRKESGEQVVSPDVSKEAKPDSGSAGAGSKTAKPKVRAESYISVPNRISPTDGKPADTGMAGAERPESVDERPGRGTDNTGSSGTYDYGLQPEPPAEGEPTKAPDTKIEKRLNDSEKIKLTNKERVRMQDLADRTHEVKLKDRQNIMDTLPWLLTHQVTNVLKAEERFFNPPKGEDAPNKGIMFTDGTGTGKTYTGLGIVKRFVRRGITDGLVVVPTDAKVKDWIEDGHVMVLDLQQLSGIADAGKEGTIVVTTYANFRQNEALLARAKKKPFGFVLYDEAHNIVSNQDGTATAADKVHKEMTFAPQQAARIAREKFQSLVDRDYKSPGHITKETRTLIEKETERLIDQTKVVFLSASPFSYHKNLEYADGYLFNINQGKGDNSNSYNNFFVSNFGYRIRYNKLTMPETGVDVGLMERMFHTRLMNSGAVSSTRLTLDKDYSREFVLIDDKLGFDIDEGYKIATDHDLKWKYLPDVMRRKFSWLYKNQLLEAIKSRHAIDRIQKHLELGRKVIVFHSYVNNIPSHPFDLSDPILYPSDVDPAKVRAEIDKFNKEYPQYQMLDLRGLTNPIDTMKPAFKERMLVFNGTIPKNKRKQAMQDFNDDKSGKDIIIVQMQAGKEGISLHDITGNFPRVMMNLGLPYRPTDAIQTEGRPYRVGLKSNVTLEYPVLHLNFEKHAFSEKINQRVKTAENLAFGEQARNLEETFKEGYRNPVLEDPNDKQGVGGKDQDFTFETIDEFQRAISLYIARGKRNAKTKAKEGVDYYATPEPVGLKMVEWLHLKPNDQVLEPSAGHGAIARFFPLNTTNRMIEPSYELRADLAVNSIGDVVGGTFEDHHIVNKYDGIAMNPPYGSSGKTAMEHLEKALIHLRDGGRVIAILPDGPAMQTRLDKFWESKESKGLYLIRTIKLPAVTFERAGTSVRTQIVVIDKQTNEKVAERLIQRGTIELQAETYNDLFDRIKDMDMPERLSPTPIGLSVLTTSRSAVIPIPGEESTSTLVEGVHTKYGYPIWTVKMNRNVEYTDFQKINTQAKGLEGYYSSYNKGGAIRGFIFKDPDKARELERYVNANFTGDPVDPTDPNNKSEGSYNMVANPSKGRTPISAFETRVFNKDGKPFKMYESVIKLAHKYNPESTLGQGHTTRGALGTFYTPTRNVRVTGLNDLSVAMHELTHALDYRFKVIKNFIDQTKPGDPLRKKLTELYVQYYPQAKPSDDLRKRMVEGYATLVQKYIELPSDIKNQYPELVDAFITPGGKYFVDQVSLFVEDVENIIRQYQQLDPLAKMGTRIVNEQVKDLGTEKFLSPEDVVTREVFDDLYPLEKIAKLNGTHFTQDDISLWVRLSNNALQLAEKNISSKKEEFWTMDSKGEFKPTHKFNYRTLVKGLEKRGLQDDFAAFLYARRIKSEYDEKNQLEEELEVVGSEAYLAQIIADMKVDIDTAKIIVKAKQADLQEKIDRLASILDNEGVSEAEAVSAYEAGHPMFENEEKMYDQLVDEDLEFAHNPQVQLLDDDGYDKFKSREGYATFKRAFYDELVGDTEVPTIKQVGKTKVSQFLARRGSSKPVLNPLIGAMMNHAEIMRKGLKQMVYNKFLSVAEKNPDLFQVLQLQTTEDKSNRYPQDKDPNIIMARKGYKRVPILADKEIKQVLDENYDYSNANMLERVGITMSQLFRTGTTGIFWQFFINNTFLDQAAATINSRNGMVPFFSSMRHVVPAIGSRIADRLHKKSVLIPNSVEAAYLKEYLFLAGNAQTFLSADISSRKKLEDIIIGQSGTWANKVQRYFETVVNFLSLPGNATEIMTRGTEYIMARKAGKSQAVALEEAGRVSAPFHHVGRHQYGTGHRATPYVRSVAYFNSALQVFKQTKDSLHTPTGRKRYAFTALSLMAASVGSVLYILGQDDDDERKQLIKSLPPDAMTKYLFLPNPYSTKKLIQIRIPEQVGFMAGVMNMMLVEGADQTDYKWTEYGEASMAFLPTQVNPFGGYQMLFSYLPQGIKPGIETTFGMKTYPGVRPIETQADKNLPPELRYNQFTSPAAIHLGEVMGWSPKKIDHFLEGTFGRSVKYVTGKSGAYGVGNIFNRELYFQSSRQVQLYYETKEINDQRLKAYFDGEKEYTDEEVNKMQEVDNLVYEIEGMMQYYKDASDNNDAAQTIYTRNMIFKKIRDLEKVVYF